MKRALSILLATVMAVSMMAVPAFAVSEPVEDPDHGSYDWSATGVEIVTGKDKNGNSVWVRGTSNNTPVKELSECPKMDYVKTIEGVTFSNYIRHTTADTKDAAGNSIHIYKVYIGLDGAMRSDKGNVEFMTHPKKSYNYQNDSLVKTHGGAVNPSMDMNHYKTNTVYFEDSVRNTYRSLSDIGITPYADGGNYGRANDGTWKSGLTWVFNRHKDGEKSNGSYGAIYPIRVNQGDTVTYYQVAVTDDTNYSGSRVTDPAPVPPAPTAPVPPPAAVPSLKSFSDVLSSHWAHTPIMKMVAKGLFAGTSTPDANGVGTFAPDAAMTSAQFITVVTKYLYEDELAAIADRHKNSGIWYSANYELALSHGLITKAEFPPAAMDKPMNRQEMAMVLVRAADQLGQYPSQLISPLRIADYDKIDSYYKDYVQKCYSMGMICGTDNKGTFAPVATLTRAQAATVLYRLVDPTSRQEIDFSVPDTQ